MTSVKITPVNSEAELTFKDLDNGDWYVLAPGSEALYCKINSDLMLGFSVNGSGARQTIVYKVALNGGQNMRVIRVKHVSINFEL